MLSTSITDSSKETTDHIVAPLEVIALFQDAIPDESTPRPSAMVPFKAYRMADPSEWLALHLANSSQSLTASEKEVLSRASAAVLFKCDDRRSPTERLPGCVQLLQWCHDAGTVGVVLPAAQKLIGKNVLQAVHLLCGEAAGYLDVFLRNLVVRENDAAN